MKIIINKQEFNVDVANNFKKRLFGLMGKKNITKGIYFPKTRSIHTFFMKEEIDVIMIDKNNNVVYYQKGVRKNKIIIKKKAYHTIELPSNSLNNISIGDKLIIN
jgi:uncharacterized membrane protein (UPF0127 family)